MSIMGQTRERKRTEAFSNSNLLSFFKLNLNFTYIKVWNRSCFVLDFCDLATAEWLGFAYLLHSVSTGHNKY